MSIEYKIRFVVPDDYNPRSIMEKLPSPMKRGTGEETYNFKIESDGFYFIDHLNERKTASFALQVFIDEALKYSDSIEIHKP